MRQWHADARTAREVDFVTGGLMPESSVDTFRYEFAETRQTVEIVINITGDRRPSRVERYLA